MSRFRNTLLLNLITTVGMAVGYGSTILVANYFGTSRVMDAYSLADLLFFILVIYTEPLKEASIAILKGLELTDRDAANRSFSAVFNWIVLGSIVLVLLTGFLIDPVADMLVGHNLADRDLFHNQVVSIALWLLPLCILHPLATILEGYLYVQQRYLVAQISKLIGLGVAIGVLIVGQSHWGILAYVAYRVVTFAVQVLGCLAMLPSTGFRYRFSLRVDRWRALLGQFGWLFFAELSMLAVVVLVRIALRDDTGALAAFGYAEKVWGALLLILVAPIGSVIWSDLIASRHEGEHKLWEELHTPLRLLLTLLAGISMLLLCLSVPAIRVIFQRGEFDATSTALTAQVLPIMGASLPFWGLMLICARALVIQNKSRIVLQIKVVINGLAVVAVLWVAGWSGGALFAPVYAFMGSGIIISVLLLRAVFAGAGRTHHLTYTLYLVRIMFSVGVVTGLFFATGLDAAVGHWTGAPTEAVVGLIHWHGLASLCLISTGLLVTYFTVLALSGERVALRYIQDKCAGLLRR